jgi:hypothetical protein
MRTAQSFEPRTHRPPRAWNMCAGLAPRWPASRLPAPCSWASAFVRPIHFFPRDAWGCWALPAFHFAATTGVSTLLQLRVSTATVFRLWEEFGNSQKWLPKLISHK